jgi:hypothetical protein
MPCWLNARGMENGRVYSDAAFVSWHARMHARAWGRPKSQDDGGQPSQQCNAHVARAYSAGQCLLGVQFMHSDTARHLIRSLHPSWAPFPLEHRSDKDLNSTSAKAKGHRAPTAGKGSQSLGEPLSAYVGVLFHFMHSYACFYALLVPASYFCAYFCLLPHLSSLLSSLRRICTVAWLAVSLTAPSLRRWSSRPSPTPSLLFSRWRSHLDSRLFFQPQKPPGSSRRLT